MNNNIFLILLEFFNFTFKGAHSNICMKIQITSKLTQYFTNIFKIRFLVINCLKIHVNSNAKMEYLKTCRATMVP